VLVLERALWMTRLGVAWSFSEHLPLSVSFAPLWVRQADPFEDGAADHLGVSLGAGAEVPLGSTRAAPHAALEDDVVFWRTAPGALDATASHRSCRWHGSGLQPEGRGLDGAQWKAATGAGTRTRPPGRRAEP